MAKRDSQKRSFKKPDCQKRCFVVAAAIAKRSSVCYNEHLNIATHIPKELSLVARPMTSPAEIFDDVS